MLLHATRKTTGFAAAAAIAAVRSASAQQDPRPAVTASLKSILLGPFGAEGAIMASVVTADEEKTVYYLDCATDAPCDISPFTVTEGDKDLHIITEYEVPGGTPTMSADYSCSYTDTAPTDLLTCELTTTTGDSVPTTAITTEYEDPNLYMYEITITAGFEHIGGDPAPTDSASDDDAATTDDSTASPVPTTLSTAVSTGVEAPTTSGDGSDNDDDGDDGDDDDDDGNGNENGNDDVDDVDAVGANAGSGTGRASLAAAVAGVLVAGLPAVI